MRRALQIMGMGRQRAEKASAGILALGNASKHERQCWEERKRWAAALAAPHDIRHNGGPGFCEVLLLA